MTACRAALHQDGTRYPCVEPAPHPGLVHRNPDAHAIWEGVCDGDTVARYLMIDTHATPEMTLAEFHHRHGISYSVN